MDITDEVSVRHVYEDDPKAVDPDEIEDPNDSVGTNDDSVYYESISSSIDTDFLNIFTELTNHFQ